MGSTYFDSKFLNARVIFLWLEFGMIYPSTMLILPIKHQDCLNNLSIYHYLIIIIIIIIMIIITIIIIIVIILIIGMIVTIIAIIIDSTFVAL